MEDLIPLTRMGGTRLELPESSVRALLFTCWSKTRVGRLAEQLRQGYFQVCAHFKSYLSLQFSTVQGQHR